jgi:hypothetical protein
MHPVLIKISELLEKARDDKLLLLQFGLCCVEDVASNLEDDDAISALNTFREFVANASQFSEIEINKLATTLEAIAKSHHGSKSIDGTRHAAVSATYALAKAAAGLALDAAAYSAYSAVYGYGSYAVSDPDAFTEIHQKQLSHLLALNQQSQK